jgi:hypothetical protein
MNPATGPILRDIHLPPPPWWPPAPGWWLVAALCVLCGIFAFVYARRRVRRRRQRRAVLAELDRGIAAAGDDPAALAAALSRFLRRLTRHIAPAAAAYPGERWLAWLDERAGSDEFRRGVGRVLLEAPFRRDARYDTAALIALVRRFARIVLAQEVARA